MKKKLVLTFALVLTLALLSSACYFEQGLQQNNLIGKWEYVSGNFVYFFGRSQVIEFFRDGTVYEYDERESGEYSVIDDERLKVKSDYSGTYIFTYSLSGDTLTITDHDMDSVVYRRTDSTVDSTASEYTSSPVLDDELVGLWQFNSGSYVYYFLRSDYIEFFDNGAVFESEGGENGVWSISDEGKLVVSGEYGSTYTFAYSVSDGTLAIEDSDGDVIVYKRVDSITPFEESIDSRLIGKWNYASGNYVYFFGRSENVEFFEDGTVNESTENTTSFWYVTGEGSLRVRGQHGNTYLFNYIISEDTLVIEDEDGDIIIYKRPQ